jgi:L-methionine (R)-S-oxide reductase
VAKILFPAFPNYPVSAFPLCRFPLFCLAFPPWQNLFFTSTLNLHPSYFHRMFELKSISPTDKPAAYAELAVQLGALLHGERDWVANAANTSALLWHSLPDLNWAGFYRLIGPELVLGPFQGKPACVRIQLGRGVCGTAAVRRQTVLVPEVHAFPGHIACDAASRSEIVVPLIKNGQLLGVLDLDSPLPARFDPADQAGLEQLASIFQSVTDKENP